MRQARLFPITFALLIAAGSVSALGQEPAPPGPYKSIKVTLPPRQSDASLDVFRKELGDIATKKDRAALAGKVLAKDRVISSFNEMTNYMDKTDLVSVFKALAVSGRGPDPSYRCLTGPDEERDRLYHEMTRIMEMDTVWFLTDSRIRNTLQQPHVVGFTKHPVLHAEWLYLDLDPKPQY